VLIEAEHGHDVRLASASSRRVNAKDRSKRASYLVNALRPVIALPTTKVLISFVPS